VPRARDLPSGQLSFFFSDVEGSTRLLTDLGARFATLLGDHQRLMRGAFAAHRGTEISTEGDSFFAVFTSALDAVGAAADAQRSLAAYDWPVGHEFHVRIGIHTGRAILAGDNYVGIEINRAARISSAANGGQVVLSHEVSEAVAAELPADLALLDLGRHRLKDVGVTRLWQLQIGGLEARSSPLRTLEANPSNLPAQATSFVDRETEVAALRRLITDNPIVTITGAGGIGKSRLAVEFARAVLRDYPDGVFYLDLAPIDRIETAIAELAVLMDVRIPPTGDVSDVLLEYLKDRRVLWVLETADRHPGIATFVARVVENCPTTRLLVSARAPLHVRAEQELSVQPLPIPALGSSLESALGSPSVELFVRRAQAVKPSFELTVSNVDAVCAIVRRIDGLALAVELAASATRLLSPSAILSRLEQSMPLPGGAPIDAPERQRTLADTIAWTYELLQSPDQSFLQRLAVFAGVFDLRAVAAVATDVDRPDWGEPRGLDALSTLIDHSLVLRVESDDEDRYRLLGPIRDFAAAALNESKDSAYVRNRHATYMLEVAGREAQLLDTPREIEALSALDRAGDELRVALGWAIASDHVEHLGLRLAAALGRPWYLRGRVHEGATWLMRALAADPEAPREIRAEALHWLGVMLDEQRDEANAIDRLDEALAIQREMGDERAIARELNSLGVVRRNIGDLEAAESLLMESLNRRRARSDLAGVATVLTNLGIVAIDRRHFVLAIARLEEALEIDQRLGARGGSAYSSSALGTARLRAGQRDEADSLLRSALSVFHELEDVDGIAESLERLGEVAVGDDPGRAARLLLGAQSIRERERIRLRQIDEDTVSQLLGRAVDALGPDQLAAARADAAAMDVDAAVAFALADRHP
jgi:predicted ATPase/class 3 adenylate cyclase